MSLLKVHILERHEEITLRYSTRHFPWYDWLTLIRMAIKNCKVIQLGVMYVSHATNWKLGGLPVRGLHFLSQSYWSPGIYI